MSRKYPSMQDELQARKAAGEYGDLSEYNRRLYRNEPEWAKKSREDYERSQKISNNGAGQSRWHKPETQSGWSLHDDDADWHEAPSYGGSGAAKQKSHPGKQKSSVRKQKTPKIPKQKAAQPRPTVQHPRKGKTGCLIAVALLFVVLPLIGAIISVIGDIVQDFGRDYTYDYEYADDWESEDSGELDEDSSYTEAENFIFEQVDGGAADEQELTALLFVDTDIYTVLSSSTTLYATDGYVMIWADYSEDEDPGEVMSDLVYVTDEIRSVLDENGYDDVPVGVVMKEIEDWKLRLVMIDNIVYFASGDYANLGE